MRKIKATLQKALHESGKILVAAMSRPKRIQYKGAANLVTQTDKLAEARVVSIIKSVFPDHDILAEETATDISSLKSPYRWVIDPIDGTTNFAHGLPLASVSIGFEAYGKIVLGGVFNPFLKELFWAERGKGAYLNKKRIHVSQTGKLLQSLLVTGFPYDRTLRAHDYLEVVGNFMKITHGVRRLGSASLDLCYVACGRFDGYWESKLMPWDQAAGYLIAEEAGARVTDFEGKPFNIYYPQVLATNGKIHGEMLRNLKPFLAMYKRLIRT